jgi:pyruvate formate lyase activating enzyme
MACVETCWHGALEVAGRLYTEDELMLTLIRDQGYWGSQGGVTFAGGEPMVQYDFLSAILAECQSNYIHTALETSAYTRTSILTETLKWIDELFIDIKHMDAVNHRQGTGVGNELILNNIKVVATSGWEGRLIIRVPIIPGYNDTIENLQATADFMGGLGLAEVNLLPFHRLGQTKYDQLGLVYEYAQVPSPSMEVLTSYQRIFDRVGLNCYIDSDIPF